MTRLRVAVLPSLQDTNKFPHPITGQPWDERAQVHTFAPVLLAVNGNTSGISGVEMRLFTDPTWKYSADTYHLEHLHKQQQAAYPWLESVPGIPTVALNLHTDGVKYTHVGGYWDSGAPQSHELAVAVRDAVAPTFLTTTLRGADYSNYIFALEMHHRHRPVLLEMGDHLMQQDRVILFTRAEAVAQAIVDELVQFFGLPVGRVTPETLVPNYGTGQQEPIGEGFASAINEDATLGMPRFIADDRTPGDGPPDKALYLKATPEHPLGPILFYRVYLNDIETMWTGRGK